MDFTLSSGGILLLAMAGPFIVAGLVGLLEDGWRPTRPLRLPQRRRPNYIHISEMEQELELPFPSEPLALHSDDRRIAEQAQEAWERVRKDWYWSDGKRRSPNLDIAQHIKQWRAATKQLERIGYDR